MKKTPKRLNDLFEYVKHTRPDLTKKQADAAALVLHGLCRYSTTKRDEDSWVLKGIYEAGLTDEERLIYDALQPLEQSDYFLAAIKQGRVKPSSNSTTNITSIDELPVSVIPESICMLTKYIKQIRRDLTDIQAYYVAMKVNERCTCFYLARGKEYWSISDAINKEGLTFEDLLDLTSLSNNEKCRLISESSDSPEEIKELAIDHLKNRNGCGFTPIYPFRWYQGKAY